MPTKKNVAKYVGRYAEVRVPALGDIIVESGAQVEVEDDDVFLSLLDQPVNWQWVSGVKRSQPEPDPEVEVPTTEEGSEE